MGRLAGIRIGVDGYNLALARGTGIATYARGLTHCLRDLGCKVDILYGRRVQLSPEPILREIAFIDPDGVRPRHPKRQRFVQALTSPFGCTASLIELQGRVLAREVAASLPYFDRIAAVPDLVHRAMRHFNRWGSFLRVRVPDPPAVMHWTYPLPIRVEGARNVYTLHDLVPLKLPYLTLDDKKYYHALIRACVDQGGHICTVSERSKADIREMFGVDESRISVTYQSVVLPEISARQEPAVSRRHVEDVYGFRWQGYFLFFGAIEPKKNLRRLIEATLRACPSRPLVIVGDPAWKALDESNFLADYEREIAATGAPRRLHKFSYLPAEHLVALVRGARAVLFPSLYEGFGLPIIEAMAMGTPVLTASEGSMPEIAGDAALLVDPYDVGAMAEAITTLDRDDRLVAELAARGPAQAARFGIPPYRERLELMYSKVLGLSPA
ncbi:glycosyltransferase family 1 protein [Zavarzinia aquatilis]|uniref:Glycosyltransferase family 1 protein n=2 Tax=Zavarzinia aquatilis TaxID=2211142 RepID=A0A317E4G2_9PROT|nr:glycosyltransferase family 1 protein [Zavarzinia aquatilis]